MTQPTPMPGRTLFHIPESEPIVTIQRTFDAPVHLVFDASTKREYVARWWGYRDATMTECKIDLRVGGSWRFVLRMPDGTVHGFGGVYREIVRPKKLVYTSRYDGYPDAEAVETLTFEARGGKTLLTATVRHTSLANRDGHVAAGMQEGCIESHDRLAELLAMMH